DWKSRVSHLQLFRRLDERKAIDFATYEKLHSNKCASPVGKVEGFRLEDAGNLYPAMGIRKYTLR
ncbi:MAG TPA: hydroxymethylglutaryl-CoA synthase, partial [Bacteroidetes bacterium]|nr:hydroxymethylglutaryl-CoA synthase [Bacteroidota bacterium]